MAKLSQEEIKQILAPISGALNENLVDSTVPSIWEMPEGYRLEKFYINGSLIEHLVPEKKKSDLVVLHFHGGAYEFRLLDFYRDAAVAYSKAAQDAEVYSLDYKVAPSNTFPSAMEEAVKVYKWLLEQGYDSKNIIIAGDSAGGNLTLVTTLYLRDNNLPMPRKILAISPWVYLGSDFDSYTRNKDKDLILGEFAAYAYQCVENPKYAVGADTKNPYVSPMYGDFTNFPPMLVQCGDAGVLFDEIENFANQVKKYDVDFTFHVFKDMSHDFQLILPMLDETQEAWKEIGEFFSK